MKNRKEKVLNKIFEEDKNNLSLLNLIQKHQIIKVINCYQNYINSFINVSDEDLNNLYNIINKDLLEYYD
tara:strand:+ start:7184 stop:7393 length:210 start_codon:yes stop_codon:yes gene_type:complete